jgi:hypothetical protein
MRAFPAACAVVLALATVAGAQNLPAIVVGNHLLEPDTPNQQVLIDVTGGAAVQLLDLNAQVADGGPAAGGMILGPAMGADILDGTIFAANHANYMNFNGDLHDGSQYMWLSVTTDSGTVAANGLLVTLTFDTTGFDSGSWPLILTDTIHGSTNFGGIGASITNGSIAIIPEPSTCILAALGSLTVLARRSDSGPFHP